MALYLFFSIRYCKAPIWQGTFKDVNFTKGAQILPGKLQCEYYNLGGEGIAYHDTDTINKGSGGLNKGTDYLSRFRYNEGVDVSFTKFHDSIDNSRFNLVAPEEGQLYLGWTEAGEWTTYTVNVQKTGTYEIGIMYTANQNGQISISTDKGATSGTLNIKSTFHPEDSINWRQWHHWNYDGTIGTIHLKGGEQTLTLTTVAIGQMNYDYINFKLKATKN